MKITTLTEIWLCYVFLFLKSQSSTEPKWYIIKNFLYIHPSSKSNFYLKITTLTEILLCYVFCFWKANLLLSQNGPFWRVDKVYGCTTTLFALWFVAAVKKLTFLKSQIRKIWKEICIFYFFELEHCKIAMGFGCRSGDS